MSATTADDDSDGRIDRALLRFSENSITPRRAHSIRRLLAGYQVTGAGAADGTDVSIGLVEGPGADSGARPACTYSRDSVEDVRDATGNVTLNSSIAQSTDGARPVCSRSRRATSTTTGGSTELNPRGPTLVHADDTSAPFAVSASGFSVARVRAAAGDDLAIDLADRPGSTPAPSLT